MSKTLLQIVNTTEDELGLTRSTSVIGSTSAQAIQLLALLNSAGEELRDFPEDGWKCMQTEFNLAVNPYVTGVGNTTANSPTLVMTTFPTTTPTSAYVCTGTNIPTGARVLSVAAPNITLTMNATGSATGNTFTFGNDTYNLPSDFRHFVNRTAWDRTNRWELLGPDSPQMDQWHRSGIIATGPRRHFRQIGKVAPQYRIWPAPTEITSPIQLVFEYISTSWVNTNGLGAAFTDSFVNDADTSVLDDRALIHSLKYRYWFAKGFAHKHLLDTYQDYVDRLFARDGGAPTLNLVKRMHPIFISPANVQDGYYPGPVGPNMS